MPTTEAAENGIDELTAVAPKEASRAVGVTLQLATFHPDQLVRTETLDFAYLRLARSRSTKSR
jgi:hypothetical protein